VGYEPPSEWGHILPSTRPDQCQVTMGLCSALGIYDSIVYGIYDSNVYGICDSNVYGIYSVWRLALMVPPDRCQVICCYLSYQRFHFCFETFHSRLLSRWAALLNELIREHSCPNSGQPLPGEEGTN